jgi:NADH-quinone oxidoreductase subunit H
LAETYRVPFDLPEAEGEIVAGVHVEYSAILFALFYLAEYASLIFMSFFIACLFFGGFEFFGYYSSIFLFIKGSIILHVFLAIRATLPRYRYDQLLDLG